MHLVQENLERTYAPEKKIRREKEKSGLILVALLVIVVWAIGFVWWKTSLLVGLTLLTIFILGVRAIPTQWFGAQCNE